MVRRVIIVLAVAALALGLTSGVGSAKSSEQVVFSIAPTFTNSFGPFGFWIWCQPEGTSPVYVGACAGTIYFYGTTRVEQVLGNSSIAEGATGIYTISINTSDISCKLTNETASPHGSGQKIDVSCIRPFRGTETVTGVVNVTGG
jgi:hypothetical protein